jgi:hypothetical protein
VKPERPGKFPNTVWVTVESKLVVLAVRIELLVLLVMGGVGNAEGTELTVVLKVVGMLLVGTDGGEGGRDGEDAGTDGAALGDGSEAAPPCPIVAAFL